MGYRKGIKMKIFNKEKDFVSKVNFVDENNIFVGYDIEQDCCEQADWFLLDKIATSLPDEKDFNQDFDVSQYVFDAGFFQEVEVFKDGYNELDSGGMVAFKLVNKEGKEMFLHLFNSHNGYYGHGFEVKHSGVVVREDTL